MSENFNFDNLVVEEYPVVYKGQNYILREADSAASVAYRNRALNCVRYSESGNANQFNNLADLEPYLVSLCLFKEDGTKVSEATLKTWPSRVVKQLYNKAKEISYLTETDSTKSRLMEALESEGSSINKEQFDEWVASLGEEHAKFKSWYTSKEDKIKN